LPELHPLPAPRARSAAPKRAGINRAKRPTRASDGQPNLMSALSKTRCLTGCTPENAPVTWSTGLTLVRAWFGARLVPAAGRERYSTEVQQLTRTRGDLRGRGRTVTCTDGRGWTCCRQMACKRSAVRARLAPQEIAGQTLVLEPSRCSSRSSDRHLTVGLSTDRRHPAARIGPQ
jgi:hypothetical protein